jgi:hypothetical protein
MWVRSFLKGKKMRYLLMLVGILLLATGCGETAPAPTEEEKPAATPVEVAAPAPVIESNPLRNAYFGDTHIHTILSFDAYLMGTRRTTDDA